MGVALAVFFLTYASGGFNVSTRAYAGIVGWWLLGVGAALGIGAARAKIGRLPLVVLVLLVLFALWTLLSWSWAPDAGRAFAQFDLVSLYVAVFLLAVVFARLVPASRLVGGVALALVGVAAVALVSRLFPSAFGTYAGTGILTALRARLSFPLGYWNGLGIDVAMAYPLVLAAMGSRSSRLARTLAALAPPLLAADMYLTSSRGAFTAAAVAVAAYLLLAPNRWTALFGVGVAGASGAVAVAVLVPRKALVNGEGSALAAHQGHHAALWIGLACLGSAFVWLVLTELGRRIPAPPRIVGWAVAVCLVAVALVAIVASHPVARFDDFRSNGTHYTGSSTFVTNHLLSSSGSGRWQFWGAAVSEFRAHPLVGGGAGSWEFWWLRHESVPIFTQFAHSLYLETLAELGIIGLLLLGGAILTALAGAVRSSLALGSAEVAAASATAIAFFAAAAYDWVWPLAGMGLVGVGCLGLALGALPSSRPSQWGRFSAARPLLALLAVAAIVPQVVVLSAALHLRASQRAAAQGDVARAHAQALAAKAIEPWASDAYAQLALIYEGQQRYAAARAWIGLAIDRSPQDWALWLTAERIDTERGRIAQARRELAEARRLNPHSALLRAAGS